MTNAEPEPLRDATRVVHAGVPAPVQGAPQLPGPALASHFHVEGDPATAAYAYGRDGNPTWTLYERALALCDHDTLLQHRLELAVNNENFVDLFLFGEALDHITGKFQCFREFDAPFAGQSNVLPGDRESAPAEEVPPLAAHRQQAQSQAGTRSRRRL